MTAIATGFWRKRPWLLKLFSTIFALKTFFRESHYSFMQIQYKRFIASLGNILIVIVILFHDVYIALLAFAIRCWGRKLEKCRCLSCSFLLFKCVETLFLHWNDHMFVGIVLITIEPTSFTSSKDQISYYLQTSPPGCPGDKVSYFQKLFIYWFAELVL